MSEPENERPLDLGIFARRSGGLSLTGTDLVAAILSVVWVAGMLIYLVLAGGSNDGTGEGGDGFRLVVILLALFIPVALIWVAALTARSMRMMREESARLQTAINAMRHSYIQQQQSGVLGVKSAVENKLEEIAAAQRRTDAALAKFTSSRPAVEAAAAAQVAPLEQFQPSLALATPAEELAPPLSVADFIRAANFPLDAKDKEGFRTLRRALQDRQTSQLIQAAQDVLTLLSQDGIYMDDLTPDRARPEIWRRFAHGERGKAIATLGGIRDRTSIALAAGRMRQDNIFRDAVHHFLRVFDRTFVEFEKTATDQDIVELAATRSACAFMLLGRVAGTFD